MAFRPAKGQNFFLVPKFEDPKKNIAIGTSGSQLGQTLTLKDIKDSQNSDLHFRFDQGGHICWMKMHGDNYIAVHASSQDDGIPIIHWQWQVSPNLQFQFIPAGNGFYRIRANHSGKFMDIIAMGTTEGSRIVQHQLTGGWNQVFKPVPVPNQKLAASPASFVETSELVRTAILGLIGLAPEVGGGLKFIVGLFWTEKDKLGDFWNQMKSYVDARVYAILKEQRLKDLTDLLNGYMNLIKEISRSPAGQGTSLRDSVIYPLVVAQESYLKKSVELLPYIMGFGTIMITLRRSMVVDYKALFGTDDAAQVALNKQLLKETITKYTAAVDECVKAAKEWRMSFIPDRHSWDEPHTVKKVKWVNHFSVAQDNYDGWRQQWMCRTGKDPIGPTDHRSRADHAVNNRRKQVEVQFDSEMSEFVRQAKLWKYFDPDEKPYLPAVVTKEVGVFGGRHGASAFSSDPAKRITDIYFHWWNGGHLCGFEIYENSVSKGVQGCRGNMASVLKLDADESINSIYGYGQDFITGLWFSTHKGKLVGGGATDGSYFCGDVADGYNAKLKKIAGANDGSTLQQISFTWEYTD